MARQTAGSLFLIFVTYTGPLSLAHLIIWKEASRTCLLMCTVAPDTMYPTVSSVRCSPSMKGLPTASTNSCARRKAEGDRGGDVGCSGCDRRGAALTKLTTSNLYPPRAFVLLEWSSRRKTRSELQLLMRCSNRLCIQHGSSRLSITGEGWGELSRREAPRIRQRLGKTWKALGRRPASRNNNRAKEMVSE